MTTATKPLTNVQYKKLYFSVIEEEETLKKAKALAQAEWGTWVAECVEKAGKKAKGVVPSLEERNVKRAALMEQHAISQLTDAVKLAKKKKEDTLYDLAEHVKPCKVKTWRVIRTSDPSSYRSQGFGADTYAQGAMVPLMDKLALAGIPVHLKKVTRKHESDGKTYELHEYHLLAKCNDWMADAIHRTIGLHEGIRSYVRFGCNPRVFMPFLDPNIDVYKL